MYAATRQGNMAARVRLQDTINEKKAAVKKLQKNGMDSEKTKAEKKISGTKKWQKKRLEIRKDCTDKQNLCSKCQQYLNT